MYFNIKCIGELQGPTDEFEGSLVVETGEFERPKFDCIIPTVKKTFRDFWIAIHRLHDSNLDYSHAFFFCGIQETQS